MRFLRTLIIIVLGSLVITSVAHADILSTIEFQVTSTPDFASTPTLGNDGGTNLVVYTSYPTLSDAGQVYYQRLSNTATIDAPVLVSNSPTDDQLNDVSGDFIVYVAFLDATSPYGEVKLYEISTGLTSTISDVDRIHDVRIHGSKVAWIEGPVGETSVMLFDVDDRYRFPDVRRTLIAGPTPPATSVEIGDTFVVWEERTGGQKDIAAYDLRTESSSTVSAATDTNETFPSTSGSWVAWQANDIDPGTRIEALNVDTSEPRIVADNGAWSFAPSMDGDIVAYESDLAGNFDIYLYRISTGDTFQATSHTADQRLNAVFGNQVAYVDNRDSISDVFVTTFSFEPDEQVCYPGLPDPELAVTGGEHYTGSDGQPYFRYWLSVTNWASFPDELFEAAPDLAPCGLNPNASRTWVDIYAQDESRIYGFCALSGSEELEDTMWFSIPSGDTPPEYVYITLTDRRCGTTYTSNLAWTNLPPVGNAGTDQTVEAWDPVALDGSASFDIDEDYPLNYAWEITSKPIGSITELNDPGVLSPSFAPDKLGDYGIQLVVTDSRGASSEPDLVIVAVQDATPPETEIISSVDGNGDPVSEGGSTVSTSITLTFDGTDAVGIAAYECDLDRLGFSLCTSPATYAGLAPGPHTVEVRAVDTSGNRDPTPAAFAWTVLTVEQAIDDIIAYTNGLDPGDFSNPNQQTAFVNKLYEVINKIQAGDLAGTCEAIDKFANDILPKTDGDSPPPDWLTDPIDQQWLEDSINAILVELQAQADALGGCPAA